MKGLLIVLAQVLSPAFIGVMVGLITKNQAAGVFTFLGIYLCYVIFIWGRQVYWYLKKEGDYENKNKKG